MAPDAVLGLSPRAEVHLFGIGREALANAVKHSGAATAWVRVQALPGRVLLEVGDDGRGFDPELDRPGHFGLESMHSRAAEIGGRLTISTGQGNGTVVRVDTAAGASVSDPPRAIRVLIVDDHAVVRRGLFAFLATEPDLDIVGDAAGGVEALTLLARLDAAGRRPDVVLMDLKMEPLDGIETTRRIRALYDDVEIVALTSYTEEARVQAALAAGAAGYVLKDADADEVAAAIRAVHRGGLQLDPAVARRLLSHLRPQAPHAPGALTARELDVLRLIGDGQANKEIAAALDLSERTVRTHVSNILGKLGLTSRTQAALWAAREGVVDLGRPDPD